MPRKGIQLAYPFEEKRLAKWKPPYIVQPKYDGVRCRAVNVSRIVEPPRYMLLSSEENPIFSVPHIVDSLPKLGIKFELDGELYHHGMSFEQIVSITSRTVNLAPGYSLINYNIFDIVNEELSQMERLSMLNLLSNLGAHITIAPYHLCNNLEDVMRAYDKFLSDGYEGIIVRHLLAPYVRKRSVYMMKFKPKKDDHYEIVGYKEETSKDGIPKDRLGALICTGDDGTLFSVGSGLTDGDRESLWSARESLKGKTCHVQYQHLTSGKKVPRFPVFVEVIDG